MKSIAPINTATLTAHFPTTHIPMMHAVLAVALLFCGGCWSPPVDLTYNITGKQEILNGVITDRYNVTFTDVGDEHRTVNAHFCVTWQPDKDNPDRPIKILSDITHYTDVCPDSPKLTVRLFEKSGPNAVTPFAHYRSTDYINDLYFGKHASYDGVLKITLSNTSMGAVQFDLHMYPDGTSELFLYGEPSGFGINWVNYDPRAFAEGRHRKP